MYRWFLILIFAFPIFANDKMTLTPPEARSARPLVTITPMIDSSQNKLSWNLSSSLSKSIRKKIEQKHRLYLVDESATTIKTQRMMCKNDPFGFNAEWMKKAFPQNEFIVFMELMHYNESPLDTQHPRESPAELHLTTRIRVFDIRQKSPKIILEEVVENFHYIPQQFNQYNFTQVAYDNESFDTSPLGMAHEALCQEIANRIEDYTLLAAED